MKRATFNRWASQLQPPRNPRPHLLPSSFRHTRLPLPQRCSVTRCFSDVSSTRTLTPIDQTDFQSLSPESIAEPAAASTKTETQLKASYLAGRRRDPSQSPFELARKSASLQALHSRLCLPTSFSVQTLARCLIDPSVDAYKGYDNSPLAVLGQDFLGYATSEHLICHYPRIPMSILFAAQYAYVGPETLNNIRQEWGVEAAFSPDPNVDHGMLQLKRKTPGNALAADGQSWVKDADMGAGKRDRRALLRRGTGAKIVNDDQFGNRPISSLKAGQSESDDSLPGVQLAHGQTVDDLDAATVQDASAGFVRAVVGALYLHAGAQVARDFFAAHFLSRKLELDKLFHFTHPTRDLSRLCHREGFEPPVARLLSETGRLSRHPVFVVGVFSGNDQLGEGAGSSLNEARVRAAAAAMRSWYLYSPLPSDVVLPSETETPGSKKKWKAQYVDPGEIIT